MSTKHLNSIILKNKLQQMVRVNQAGEFGAVRIYQGQLWSMGKLNSSKQELVSHMLMQEQTHLDAFNEQIVKHNVRSTMLRPFWSVIGFTLGAASALAGKKAAMALTVSIEEVIDKHYQDQKATLQPYTKSNKDIASLYNLIDKCWREEIEHKDTAMENEAREAPLYPVISRLIKFGARMAIKLSKRI